MCKKARSNKLAAGTTEQLPCISAALQLNRLCSALLSNSALSLPIKRLHSPAVRNPAQRKVPTTVCKPVPAHPSHPAEGDNSDKIALSHSRSHSSHAACCAAAHSRFKTHSCQTLDDNVPH